MRKSLAPHAADRMRNNEDVARTLRRLQHAQEVAAVVNSLWAEPATCIARESTPTMGSATFVSDLGGLRNAFIPVSGFVATQLQQRAERAERNAASWHRLAILLAVACALLLVIR